MPGPISKNGDIFKGCVIAQEIFCFKFQLNRLNRLNARRDNVVIRYCISSIMVTITSHIFINILKTVHFSALKINRGNEKNNYQLSSDAKISESLKKNLTQSDRTPLNTMHSVSWPYK